MSEVVEGYVICDHGHPPRWVRNEVARITGGFCDECSAAGKRLETIELVMRGRRIRVPVREGARPKRRHKVLTAGRIERKKLAANARDAARKRLAAIFPDLYDTLLAEERARLGLEPWPVQIAVRASNPEDDIVFAEMLAELQRRRAT